MQAIIYIRHSFHHLSTYILRVSCLPPTPFPGHLFPAPNKDAKWGLCIYYKRIETIFRWDM